MSVINQMLRDLDARGAAPAGQAVTPAAPPARERRPAARTLAWMCLIAAAVAALYWVWTNGSRHARPVDSLPPPQRVEPAAKAAVPAVAQPLPAKPAGAEPPFADEPVAPVAGAPRDVRQPAAPPASKATVAAAAHGDPAVRKNVTELSPEAEAQQLVDDAQTLRRAGRLDAAIGKYRQALGRDPGAAPARIQLAGILQERGEADAALALLKSGYEQRADDTLAIAAGRLLADLGQRDEALGWLARAPAGLRPADHALTGALLSQAGRHEEASRAFQRALAADPAQGGWLLGLGLALEAQGRTDEARVAYRNALERGQFTPDVARFLLERGGSAAP
jgi:MSHA biogenesis protein MshN